MARQLNAELADHQGLASAKRYLPHVDGLRALAVSLVLLCHLRVQQLEGGYVGVDVFFVISGFLITRLLKNEIEQSGSVALRTFYMRRLWRLAPALLVTMLGAFAFAVVVFPPELLQHLASSAPSALLYFSNHFFYYDQGYFQLNARVKPLLHTWSLSVEEQFYLIWPLAILVATKCSGSTRKVPISIVVAVLGALSLAGSVAISESLWAIEGFNAVSGNYYLMPFRVFEFAIGAALPRSHLPSFRKAWFADLALIVGLALVIGSAAIFNEFTVFPGWRALIPCFGAAICIWSGGSSVLGRALLNNRCSLFIGRISYSLYLVHWPTVVFYECLAGRVSGLADRSLVLLLSIALAFVLYRFVERRFRYQAGPDSVRRPVGALLALSAALLLLATHADSHWGWPWRLKTEGRQWLARADGSTDEFAFGGALCTSNTYCDSASEEGRETLYLLGESHAWHYFDGLVQALPKLNIRYWQTMCPSYSLSVCNRPYDRRDHFLVRERALEAARASVSPVVISQVLRYSIERGGRDMVSGDSLRFDYSNRDALVKYVVAELRRVRHALPDNKIVLIGETPRVGSLMSPLQCETSPLNLECDRTSLAVADLQFWRQANRDLKSAAADLNILFLDPFDQLCSDDGCQNIIDGKAVYSDSHHLSDFGSKWVVQGFAPSLADYLELPPGVMPSTERADASP